MGKKGAILRSFEIQNALKFLANSAYGAIGARKMLKIESKCSILNPHSISCIKCSRTIQHSAVRQQ